MARMGSFEEREIFSVDKQNYICLIHTDDLWLNKEKDVQRRYCSFLFTQDKLLVLSYCFYRFL